MTPLVEGLAGAFLRWSLEACLIMALIMLVKTLAGRRWSPRWHSAIWALLVLRLSLAWLPAPLAWTALRVPSAFQSHGDARPHSVTERRATPSVQALPATPESQPSPIRTWLPALFAWTWAAGVLLLLGRQGLVNLRLWRAVRKGRVLTSEPVLELLESCKAAMGVRMVLGVVITDRIPGPALFGFVRPRLLLSQEVIEQLSLEELRHVFLHELAHLKRMDIHWGWLSALLQVLHWFNPAVWYGFMRMRRDRELACDELAVAALSASEVPGYGRTLLKLLEPAPSMRPLPSYAAVCEDASNLKRRILLIASFQRGRHSWWRQAASCLTFCAVGLCAFSIKLQSFEGRADAPVRVDKIDYPFVDDPPLIGGWRGVDYVKKPEDFNPAKQKGFSFKERDLEELVVKPGGGTTWSAATWTKGLFLDAVEPTAGRYEIREIQGHTYLFMEWKNGDYVYRGATPWFYVMEKDPRVVEVETRVVDKIDFPFVDDPDARGIWTSVDFVNAIEQFHPGRKYWRGDLFLKRMELLEGGKTAGPRTWTKGLIIHPGDHTASRYQIKTLEGRRYLFMEWKNGDYLRGKRAPSYYVLTQ